MAIIEEYDESLFISRFEDYKRVETLENPNGNFSYKGLRALYEYLENLSEDTGEDIKLDVISLCCEYAEYKNIKEYERDYSIEAEFEEDTTEEEIKEAIEEEINNRTTLIKFNDDLDDGFIIQSY